MNVVKHYGKKMQFEEILPTSIDEPTTDDTDLVAKEAELNAKKPLSAPAKDIAAPSPVVEVVSFTLSFSLKAIFSPQ